MDHPSVSTVLLKMFHATVIIPVIHAMLYVTPVQLAKAQVPIEYQPLMPMETALVKIGTFTQACSFKFRVFVSFFDLWILKFSIHENFFSRAFSFR